MGRLVGVELYNFKSYRGRCSVGFGTSNFISIIGPNGAGKSNMMDAISFVLGIRSSHLRSTQLKDLIYRGRINDENSDSDSDMDTNPSDAYVMAIYEKGPDDLLKLRRSVSAAGQSEYSINEKVVSASEYSAVLRDENILISARNFLVFQGDVENIASKTPKERAQLFEKVSGSLDYKQQYDKLKIELDEAHDTSTSLFQRKRVLMGELKQYKEQKAESDHFEKKLEEKTNLIMLYKLWQMYTFEEAAADLIDKVQSLNDEIEAKEAALKKEEKKLSKMRSLYTKENVKLVKKKSEIESRQSSLEIAKKKLVPITTKRDNTTRKIADLERKSKELQQEIEVQEENIVQLEKQRRTLDKSLKVFEEHTISKRNEVQLPEEAIKEYDQLREQFLSEGGALQEGELSAFVSEKEFKTTQFENLTLRKTNFLERISEFQRKLSSFQFQLQESELQFSNSKEELNIKRNYLQEARIKKEQLLNQEFDLNMEMKKVLIQLDDLSASQRESARERKLKENVNNLQRLFPGVKGLVCDLCKPKQKKYEVAFDVIFGKDYDSVIVDNATVAQKCITYLKEQKAGIASFIPLDSVDSNPPQLSLRHLDSQARPVLDCIEYDPVLERAMQYVCGDALMCDNIKVAKYLKWTKQVNVKLVTLDGSLIHKAGLMTGGATKHGRSASSEKAELNALIKRKDELFNQLNALQREKPSEIAEKQILNEISELESELPLLENTVKEMQRNVEDSQTELRHQNGLLQELEKEMSSKKSSLEKVELEVEKCENGIRKLREKIYGEFAAKYNVDIEKYEKTHGILMTQQEQERAKFTKQITSLENKIEFEHDRLLQSQKRLEKLGTDITNLKDDLVNIKEERNQIQEEMELMESEIEVATEVITTLEEKLKGSIEVEESLKSNIKDLKREYQDKFKKLSTIEEDAEAQTVSKMNVLISSKVEAVSLPIQGDMEMIKVGLDTEKLLELSDQIEVDYSKLPRKYRTGNHDTIEKEFNKKIKKVTEELESLSPNVKALERLAEVEQRVKEVEENHTKSRDRELQLIDEFNEIKEKRYDCFMNAFEIISSNIDTIYKDLTKSGGSPMGGSAYLNLEDEDEPYNGGVVFNVQVPLKRFVKMELLSGGEKTIAALALLFAIHSYQPSPFFVLDEIDAALDNANVQRVANYIVKNSGPQFQFIVISLKNVLFEKSDSLVGIFREQVKNSSKTLTLDMRDYPR